MDSAAECSTREATDARPSPHWRAGISIFALWGAGLGAAGQFAKVSVVLPEFVAAYPAHAGSIGFVVSLISLVGVALGLLAGGVVAKVGVRRVLLASLLLGMAASLYQATLPPYGLLLLSRTVEGLSHLGIVVAAPTMIAAVAPTRWRDAAMTLWGTFFSVAFAIVGWIGVAVVAAGSLSRLLLGHAAYLAVAFFVLMAVLPRRRVASRPGTNVATAGGLRRAYSTAGILAPALGWIAYTTTFVALLTVLPTFVPPDARVLVSTAMPLAAISVSVAGGVVLLRSKPATTVVRLGFALGAALVVMLVPAGVVAASAIALVSCLGLVQGSTFAAIPQLLPRADDQALANGVLAQAGNLGNLVGTPLLLFVARNHGQSGLLTVVAAIWVVGFTTVGILAKRARIDA